MISKNLQSNLSFPKIFGIGILILGVIILIVFLTNKKTVHESFTMDDDDELEYNEKNKQPPEPSEPIEDNEVFKPMKKNEKPHDTSGLGGNQLPSDCYPKDQLTPTELLPGDPNSKWAQVNPVGQGDLKDQNFLNAGYHLGVNTIGQTLRNANLQLRSEPANPQVKVSPWMQSTMEPDIGRRPMEIGGAD